MRLLRLAAFFCCAVLNAQVQQFSSSAGEVKITPIFHASLMIEAGGKVIFVDPAKPAKLDGLPKADLILITDIHGDHMDADSVQSLSKPATIIWAPAAVAKTIAKAAVISNGETKSWEAFRIEAVSMYNEKRGPAAGQLFHDKGRGNGYVVTYGNKRFYISGDTKGTPEMRALKNIDVALVCMNLPYTMTPEEAAAAVKAFHPAVAISYHYRSTDLSVFEKALEGTGIEVRKLDWYPKT